jgi:acyl carrier protein phosphodiesterase
MNYLAHAYLSFNHPEVLLGNMICDYVKGKSQYDYAPLVQSGIRLHREIDQFTDQHPVTKEMMQIFHPHYRLYSGAFVDIVYDYFLANDKNEFDVDNVLFNFTQKTYAQLQSNTHLFPPKFALMFPYMISQNWLYHYQSDSGIQKSFNGLVRRAAYLEESQVAFKLFSENKVFLKERYNLFFADVKKFAAHTMKELLKD